MQGPMSRNTGRRTRGAARSHERRGKPKSSVDMRAAKKLREMDSELERLREASALALRWLKVDHGQTAIREAPYGLGHEETWELDFSEPIAALRDALGLDACPECHGTVLAPSHRSPDGIVLGRSNCSTCGSTGDVLRAALREQEGS